MTKARFAGVVLMSAALSPAADGAGKPPPIQAPQEQRDGDIRVEASGENLAALVEQLWDCISGKGMPIDAIPGIDLFLRKLEKQLQERGSDLPRDKILRNAGLARETLRVAYNDMADATAPELLYAAGDKLAEFAEELQSILRRNRQSIEKVKKAAAACKATSSAMQIRPPDSPGEKVSLDILCDIASLRDELLALKPKLKEVSERVKKARAYARRAGGRAPDVDGLAETAAALDKDANERLNERRTRGAPDKRTANAQSRAVIANASKWLKRSAKKAEDIAAMMEALLDPKREGAAMALERSLQADAKTLDARDITFRSGVRINYNHGKRLNIKIDGAIRRGWNKAKGSQKRQPWWEERARMAKSEEVAAAGEAQNAVAEAEKKAQESERLAQGVLDAVQRIRDELGRPGPKLAKIDAITLEVPDPRHPDGKPSPVDKPIKSKPLKIPRTLDVPNQEILRSYDGHAPADEDY